MTAIKISPARRAAFDVLYRIETEHSYSSSLLPIVEKDLSDPDRGLCHELTLGTLRRQIKLDRIIDTLADGKKIDPAIRVAIRLGLYQLNYLDKIPDHSAINESVNLAFHAKKTSAKGFVNAILRRSVRELVKINYQDDIDSVVVETSHPRWLVEKWIEQFGWEKALNICKANNSVPDLTFRLTKKGTDLDLSDLRTAGSANSFTAKKLTSELRNAAEKGEIYFQDQGSQMVADIAASFSPSRFLDVCAAPGGKTGCAALTVDKVFAGDIRWERVLFLKQNLFDQGIDNVAVVQYDAQVSLPFRQDHFDSVLVDAPCSGTGTIRHNPELRYLFEPNDLIELPGKQLTILKNASKVVAEKGILVYSTCSLEQEENEDVCERFLLEHSNFEPVTSNIPGNLITGRGYGRTFPDRDNIDGFFIAVFRRNK